MPPENEPIVSGIRLYNGREEVFIRLPEAGIRLGDIDAINASIREQGIQDVVCRIEDGAMHFSVPSDTEGVRVECEMPTSLPTHLMVTMVPVRNERMSIVVSEVTTRGSGAPSTVRGIIYPRTIQGASELNHFLRRNRISWMETGNTDGLLSVIIHGELYVPRFLQDNRSEEEFRARYGIPTGVCEYSVNFDENGNTHVNYSYPPDASTVFAWFPVGPTNGDTLTVRYGTPTSRHTVRYDRARDRWTPPAPNDGVLYRAETLPFSNARVTYTLNELSPIISGPTWVNSREEYERAYGTPSGVSHQPIERPHHITIRQATLVGKIGSDEDFDDYLTNMLQLDSVMAGFTRKKSYPTYEKNHNFNNQTYRVGNLPPRLVTMQDLNMVVDSYKTMTPSVFKSIRKKMSIGVSSNNLFSVEKARKFPMHPIVAEDGIQFKVMDDWHYFFFKGGAVPTDVNLKFIAFPIFEKEEWFLHEATKKNRYDMCQEHDLISYRKAAATNKTTVQGHVFEEDIINGARFWTIKSKYVKLFVSDKYKGRKYICNFYFELSDELDTEIITVKHLSSDFVFVTSGRLMEAHEVFEKLAPNPQARPFIRSNLDPEYMGYIKSTFSFKRPKFVFKAKGRKLGNLKGVCQ